MEGFMFPITGAVLIKDSELLLGEDGSISVDMYCHADSRMVPLTKVVTLL